MLGRLVTQQQGRLLSHPRRHFLTVVDKGCVAYREFLGRNQICLTPGIHWAVPWVHKVQHVDLRERPIGIKEIMANTKDNVPIVVDAMVYYTVVDAQKALYKTQNYKSSITTTGQSFLRATLGKFEWDELTCSRQEINSIIAQEIDSVSQAWGIVCQRCEIQALAPQNPNVARQLELQMAAERARRENELVTASHIRTAEGTKQAAILAAEGAKQAAVLQSEGHLVVEKNTADAKAYTLQRSGEALAAQIAALPLDAPLATQYLLHQRQIDAQVALAAGPNNSTVILPALETVLKNVLSLRPGTEIPIAYNK